MQANKGKLIKTLISLLNSNEVYSRPPLDAGLMVEERNAGEYPTDLRRSCEEITESSVNAPQKGKVN